MFCASNSRFGSSFIGISHVYLMLGSAGNEYFDTHTAGLTTNENWPGIGINLNRKLVRDYFVYADIVLYQINFVQVDIFIQYLLYIALVHLKEEEKTTYIQ